MSAGKTWEFVRFEVALCLRRPSTWAYFGLLLAASFGSLLFWNDPSGSNLVNSPYVVAISAATVGLIGVLVTAALMSDAATRDLHTRMAPHFFTAPVTEPDYVVGRFAGAASVNLLVLLAVPLGLALGARLPFLDPLVLGPARFEAYAAPFLLFLVPTMLASAAILFAISLLARRSFPAYLGAAGLILLYVTGVVLSGTLADPSLAAVLDPSSLVALGEATANWTTVEENTRLIGLDRLLRWNRLLWAAIGAGVLVLAGFRFRFSGFRARVPRQEEANREEVGAIRGLDLRETAGGLALPSVRRSFGYGTRLRQLLSTGRREVEALAQSRDFFLVILPGLALLLYIVVSSPLADPTLGITFWPLTSTVLGSLTSSSVSIVTAGLVTFFAGELIWRERDRRVDSLVDTTPVPIWISYGGKLLALGVVLVVIQTVALGTGLVVQALRGLPTLRISPFVTALLGLRLVDLLLLAVLALFVHVLLNHKYAGHLAFVLLYLFTERAHRLGIDTDLLVYGASPGWRYSDLSGFGPTLGPHLWHMLYWTGWGLLLMLLGCLLRVQGPETGWKERLERARQRFSGPLASGLAALAVVLIVGAGGFIEYSSRAAGDRSDTERAEIDAEYERCYGRYATVPQPWLTTTTLHMEIHPERHALEARATQLLVNRTDSAVDSIHLSLNPAVTVSRDISFDRRAEPVLVDDRRGYRIYALGSPLLPGDSVRMLTKATVEPQGRFGLGASTRILENGTTFQGRIILPSVGYRSSRELASPPVREEHGLAPREPSTLVAEDGPRLRPFEATSRGGWIDLDATIGTATDQVAVTSGRLVDTWTEAGRRYSRYRTDAPITDLYGIESARYATYEAPWRGVDVRILHHPTHDFNVEAIADGGHAALEYFSEHFGAYPYGALWFVETPDYGDVLMSFPGHVIYSEGSRSLFSKGDGKEGGVDRLLAALAHEVAHQWWGGKLVPAEAPGSSVLTETLAEYGALMVLEHEHGPASVHRLLRSMQIDYLNNRAVEPEVPLLRAGEEHHLIYDKGGVVMYALKDYLGEDAITGALRGLLSEFGFSGPPFPTTHDLDEAIRAAAPDSLHYLIEDLLTTITLWDLRARDARAEATGDGTYRVTLEIEAHKLRVDSMGSETEVPMNDLVEIGVFGSAEDVEPSGEPLYLAKHRVRTGRQTISVIVPERPVRAGIDPYHKLLSISKDALLRGKVVEVETPDG